MKTAATFNPDAIEWLEGFVRGKVLMQVAKLLVEEGPMCVHDLVVAIGSHRAVVSKAAYKLHAARKIYIRSWAHPGDSNTLSPVWAWRTCKGVRDAKRPEPKPRAQINKDWNARNSALRGTKQRLYRGTQVNIWAGLLNMGARNAG